jgi:hypothetical protein
MSSSSELPLKKHCAKRGAGVVITGVRAKRPRWHRVEEVPGVLSEYGHCADRGREFWLRKIDFNEAARGKFLQGGNHFSNRISNARPGSRFKDNDRDFAVFEVLLVSKVLVRRDQGVVSIAFGGFDQNPVVEL